MVSTEVNLALELEDAPNSATELVMVKVVDVAPSRSLDL